MTQWEVSMKMFVLALVCASLSGCMVQDTAHSDVSDAAEHVDSSRVNRCLDKCSQLRDCFSANHGGDVMAMCCGRRASIAGSFEGSNDVGPVKVVSMVSPGPDVRAVLEPLQWSFPPRV